MTVIENRKAFWSVIIIVIEVILGDLTIPSVCLFPGLNAGLAAYPTWLETLTGLSRSRTPAYFTDYCQYSCECSRLPLEALHLGTISEVAMNPFRSPLRKYCEEHDMPWYSNAFVYHLVYAS